METVSEVEGGAEVAGRVKDGGGATPPGDGRGSPPPNCAICLGQCQNNSFTDSCLHQFCFNCLLTWSKIKAECPLCKQIFKSIIHNVRSNHQYEEYLVEQREAEALVLDEPPNVADYTRRFRYRTTITFPRREGSAIHRLLLRSPLVADVAHPRAEPHRSESLGRRNTFRRTVYRHNLWARPLPDFTGRLRECTPEFYRDNDAQRYRLVPWLTRELSFLLDDNHSSIAYVLARILDLLPLYRVTSPEFMSAMLPYFGERTEHFLHELYCFASTPFDMLGYDRNVQYGVDPRLGHINEVISSSDSDSVDSDIVMVSSSQPAFPVPQRFLTPPPEGYAGASVPAMGNVIPIETISHSDSEDSSSEVIMVGYIKPPQDRTPEIVDLLASDSDVLVQENSPPASTSREAPMPSASSLVKLTLSRRQQPDSDSDDHAMELTRPKRKKRVRTNSASTTSTRRGTPSPSDASWNPSDTNPSTVGSPVTEWTHSDEESFSSRKNPYASHSRKHTETNSRRYRKKLKRKRARSRSPSSRSWTPPLNLLKKTTKDKSSKRKHKSRSGKDVKSSKRRSADQRTHTEDRDQPSTSGTQNGMRNREEHDKPKVHEKKKLRSVVCTLPISSFNGRVQPDITAQSSSTDEQPAMKHTIENILGTSKSTSGEDRSTESHASNAAGAATGDSSTHSRQKYRVPASSDSDDDLPLNLTVNKLK